jgi:hypothetical protein
MLVNKVSISCVDFANIGLKRAIFIEEGIPDFIISLSSLRMIGLENIKVTKCTNKLDTEENEYE